jgi:hypothetical protein
MEGNPVRTTLSLMPSCHYSLQTPKVICIPINGMAAPRSICDLADNRVRVAIGVTQKLRSFDPLRAWKWKVTSV